MGKVDISISGRTFRVGCDDGEETHLRLLADHLRRHVDNMRTVFGALGDDELYLLAALQICDELYDARSELLRLENEQRPASPPQPQAPSAFAPEAVSAPAPPAGAAPPEPAAQPKKRSTFELDMAIADLVGPTPRTRPLPDDEPPAQPPREGGETPAARPAAAFTPAPEKS